jgi:hypothetical protein
MKHLDVKREATDDEIVDLTIEEEINGCDGSKEDPRVVCKEDPTIDVAIDEEVDGCTGKEDPTINKEVNGCEGCQEDTCVFCEEDPCVFSQHEDSLVAFDEAEQASLATEDNPPSNHLQRKKMHRQLTLMLNGGPLGAGVRKELPRCCVSAARDMHPSDTFMGFREE